MKEIFSLKSMNKVLIRQLYISTFAVSVFLACGRASLGEYLPPGGVTTEVADHVKAFTELAKENGVEVNQKLYSGKILNEKDWDAFSKDKNLPPETEGLCEIVTTRRDSGFPDYKKEPTETFGFVTVLRLDRIPSLKSLIYHEFGHCLLNLDHSPTGLMAEFMEGVDSEKTLSAMMAVFFQSLKATGGQP